VDDICTYAGVDKRHSGPTECLQSPVSMRSWKDGNTTEDRIGERALLLERTYEQMRRRMVCQQADPSRTYLYQHVLVHTANAKVGFKQAAHTNTDPSLP
jgi:hypothetical protein